MAEPGYGLRIIQARRAKHWRQRDLAEAANVSPMPISNWENERSVPQFESWHKLSAALGVSIDWLKTGREAVVGLAAVPDEDIIREIMRRGFTVIRANLAVV